MFTALHWPIFRLLFFHCGKRWVPEGHGMGDKEVATPHPQPALDEVRGKGTLLTEQDCRLRLTSSWQ